MYGAADSALGGEAGVVASNPAYGLPGQVPAGEQPAGETNGVAEYAVDEEGARHYAV